MAETTNQYLSRLMRNHPKPKDVGAGEPIELEIAADSTDADVGSFYEPFWDMVEFDDHGEILGIEGPDYSPNPWDCVQLGDVRLPGIWQASATPAIKLDIQKPLNADGAAVISRGYLPASVTLTGLLWTPMQFRLLQDAWPYIWRKPFKVHAQDVPSTKKGKVSAVEKDQGEIVGTQRSLGIINPAVNMIGIFYIVVQKPTPLGPGPIIGTRQMTIECLEYVPEPAVKPSAVKKTKGSQTSTRGKNAFDKAIEEKDTRKPKAPSKSAAALEPGKV